jgi:formylglycine-generating enzyme
MAASALLSAEPGAPAKQGHPSSATGCPPEMARVRSYCIDRWEVSMIDRRTGRSLSPYYPPQRRLLEKVAAIWQREHAMAGPSGARNLPLPPPSWQLSTDVEPVAVSRPGVVPQAYLSYFLASEACANAGKRLCTEAEWQRACRGANNSQFPYGSAYVPARCNVFRLYHPAYVLHGNASFGHTDPRLNLVVERASDPLLRLTGQTPSCASRWGDDAIYDMVGNLDEWIDAGPDSVFVGGFYARSTKQGCDSRISSHAPSYYDYSLGTRCCRDVIAAP